MKNSQQENGNNQRRNFTKLGSFLILSKIESRLGKLAFSDPGYIGKSLKPIIDNFIDGSSDHLLLVDVKILLNFEGSVTKNAH